MSYGNRIIAGRSGRGTPRPNFDGHNMMFPTRAPTRRAIPSSTAPWKNPRGIKVQKISPRVVARAKAPSLQERRRRVTAHLKDTKAVEKDPIKVSGCVVHETNLEIIED